MEGKQVMTHTQSRECAICKGMCTFARVNSLVPFEEIEQVVLARRRREVQRFEQSIGADTALEQLDGSLMLRRIVKHRV